MNIGDLRINYKDRSEAFTKEKLVSKDPMVQFDAWFKEANDSKEIKEPNAMCIATSTKDGKPSNRFLLLKGYSSSGFKFFTNYHSRKGKELDENPHVAITFYWQALGRQVRAEGRVEKLGEEDNQEYFKSRPFDSRLNCVASDQSSPVPSRDYLVEISHKVLKDHPTDVPKPSHWGGYLIVPDRIEFWQGQTDRLHDRILFRRVKENEKIDPSLTHIGENGWVYERLAP